jgi:hypothetical protein
MVGTAREETLEERKQRIVRKYLRERMTITQSDMLVPSDLPEDERVTASETFKDVAIDLKAQEGSPTVIIPPPQMPRPVPQTDNNWLLDSMAENTDPTDPYADPFAASRIDSGDDLWSSYDSTSGQSESSMRGQEYDPYRDNPYAQEGEKRGIFGGRSQEAYSSREQQNPMRGSSSVYSSREDLYGSQQRDRSTYNSSLNLPGNRGTRTYGSDPSEGLLTSPFSPSETSTSREDERSRSTQGYQPYKSPYQQQREEQRQWQQGKQQQTAPEFSRPDSYQQWKERNKTWDPTADDAYINESMQKRKRR